MIRGTRSPRSPTGDVYSGPTAGLSRTLDTSCRIASRVGGGTSGKPTADSGEQPVDGPRLFAVAHRGSRRLGEQLSTRASRNRCMLGQSWAKRCWRRRRGRRDASRRDEIELAAVHVLPYEPGSMGSCNGETEPRGTASDAYSRGPRRPC